MKGGQCCQQFMKKIEVDAKQISFVAAITCREENYLKGFIWNALFTYGFDSSSDKG